MSKVFSSLAVIAILTGCVSQKKYDAVLLEQQRLIDQKDSLLTDVLATSQMVTEINTDLAQVKALGMTPTTTGDRPLTGKAEERAIMLGKVREVLARLTAAEAQIEQQKKRLASLGGERTKLLDQLTSFQATIASMRQAAEQQEGVITEQKTQIKTLGAKLDTVNQTVTTMATQAVATAAQTAADKAALRDTITHVTDEANVVYYIVGTKEQLLKAGVVANEGSKFLFFGGKTLQPARTLDPKAFRRLDLRKDTILTVDDPAKTYSIVTRQSPKFLSSTVLKDGKVKGDLHISSAEFWQPGKYLILLKN